MPKVVDHDARRVAIAEAVLRIAVDGGLESVSLRSVAAEAGISMGSVQHYFASKDEMLTFALDLQGQRRTQRITAKLTAAPAPPTVYEIVRTCLVEVLPTDPQSRSEWLAGIAFFIRSLRDPELAATIGAGSREVIAYFAARLAEAERAGVLAAGVDVEQESTVLWSLLDSQGTAIVLGRRSPDEAVAVVDYYLDRLFAEPPGPAGARRRQDTAAVSGSQEPEGETAGR